METRSWNGTSPTRPDPVDRDPSRRPGVPMLTKPSVYGGTSGAIPQQQSDVPVLVGVEVFHLTPVFGTSVPLRGLSGVLRRAAYKIAEHKGGRWMLLMLADRVDVQESRIGRHPVVSLVVASTLLGALLWRPWKATPRKRAQRALRRLARCG